MKNEQTIEKNGNKINVNLSLFLFKEGSFIVVYCPALDLSSYGKNREDALKAFDEAFRIFIDETSKKGTLEKILLRLGWKLQQYHYEPPNVSANSLKELLSSHIQDVFDKKIAIPA